MWVVRFGSIARTGLSVLVLSAVMICATGCSPGHDAVIGIGYDHSGDLVGVLRVCGGGISEAHLSPTHDPTEPDRPTVWSRRTPLTGLEAWRLQDGGTTAWRQTGPAPTVLATTHYQFTAQDGSGGYESDVVDFYGRDLLALRPGQVLVDRDGPKDQNGIPSFATAVIPLTSFSQERCPRL